MRGQVRRARIALQRRAPPRSLRGLLSCIRLDEVLVLQGAPLIGALFALRDFAAGDLPQLAALVAGNLLLVAHVFVLNDWSGFHGDLKDPNRAARTFAAKDLDRAAVGYLALGLLAASLAILGMLGMTTLVFGLAIAGLSALYSAPGIHWKGRPLLGSALHVVGGALHFLLGYATFAAIDARGVGISAFFALVFTAGHLTNEARDPDGDALNGFRTNAVVFGRARSFLAGLVLFTAAYALLALLALRGLLPDLFAYAVALYPLHLAATLRARRAGLTFASLRRLQRVYRAIYALIGLLMVVTALLP
jgi:4-hydroxybenzoate polyprenyltransferase